MKARITFLSMLAMAGMAMTSCDDDDDDRWQPDVQVVSALEEKYPGVSRAEWDVQTDGTGRYNVADFWYDGVEREAWFDNNGEWFMTESDIRYEQLPQAVRTSLMSLYHFPTPISTFTILINPRRHRRGAPLKNN